ncbi:hypothetical protein J5O04_03255 [Corynebacterium hindlerae]|uniref:hypothetical protein n=1 Tax=Corynebacterium hindlerae TaxID=699041 RepID=UPI001AD7820A|nr:hypothetical protein [Corynebacterium hindlerae]QTH60162.1 hypothetical protein J5O04_03255 [Corynebacterium hindlerae]
MGRLLLLILIIAAIYLLWKAFAPTSLGGAPRPQQRPMIKGPDDDEDFLWNIEKERFKKRREEERRREQEKRDNQDS